MSASSCDEKKAQDLQSSAPIKSKDEDAQTANEEENTDPVEFEEELLGSLLLMQQTERWWVVEEVEQCDRYHVQCSQEIEAVAPLALGVVLDAESDDRGQRARRCRHEVCISVRNVAPLHGYDLCHNPEEAELARSRNTDKDFGTNECIDVLSLRANDGADER